MKHPQPTRLKFSRQRLLHLGTDACEAAAPRTSPLWQKPPRRLILRLLRAATLRHGRALGQSPLGR